MNRDGSRTPMLPSADPSWRGVTYPSHSPSLKRKLQRSLTPQIQTQLPVLRSRIPQTQKQLPLLWDQVETQIRQHLPRIQKFANEQKQQLPARIEYLRYAHRQKSGKLIVRGLIAVSGALGFLDLTLVDQLWF